MEIAFVIGLLIAAIILFSTEKLSVDIITLLLLLALLFAKIVTPEEAFAGFSSEILIILGAIFVISGAMQETGILDAVGDRMLKITRAGPTRLLTLIMTLTSGLSAFMNNTTATAVLLQPVTAIARAAKLGPSKFLMPLAFASILGGTCTLIGTSTNVAVSGYIARTEHIAPVGMFELTPIGIILSLAGIAYMVLIGRHQLPVHLDDERTSDFEIREYVTEIVVLPSSPLIGQRIYESDLSILDFRVLKILRSREQLTPDPYLTINENDVLLVEGRIKDLMMVKKIEGIEILPDYRLTDKDLESTDLRLVEAVINPRSDLVGQTIKQIRFRDRFGAVVLAIYRKGKSLRESLGDLTLQTGDTLLLQGSEKRVQAFLGSEELTVLNQHTIRPLHLRRGCAVLGAFIAAIILSGSGLLPPAVAFLAASVFVVLIRGITVERAYEFIDWRLLIMIGGMTAFGKAMENSGTAVFLAHIITDLFAPMGIMAVLAGFMLLTVVLTQPMSNAAAALVVLPVALAAATRLGVNERTFAIAVMLSASISLIAPFEPSCVLVYGPGKYKFRDFVRVGGGLTVILLLLLLAFIPVFWPLR